MHSIRAAQLQAGVRPADITDPGVDRGASTADGDGVLRGKALIFCNRKRDVGVIHKSLVKHGYNAGALHGDLDQFERDQVLARATLRRRRTEAPAPSVNSAGMSPRNLDGTLTELSP